MDKDYLGWMAKQPPLVGYGAVTVHHVRRFGEPKDDRRTVPLPAAWHMIGWGSRSAIEALGKEKFEREHGIDLEAAIVRYNERYERGGITMSPNSMTPSQLSGLPLRVHDLALYLRKTGWQRVPHPNQRLLVFEHGVINGTEQPLRAVLASSDDYADSPAMIGNALDLLAEVQGVDVQQIAEAVLRRRRDNHPPRRQPGP